MAGRGFAARVVAWQRQHGRHGLPWQGTRDAYRIWLSEVMLQQTQVATVLDYYSRFLARFPDVATLAAAPLDEVLAMWSGLGYYSRARHLHRCAQQVVAEHGGQFPGSSQVLATLPGIGRSTAAAIAAFAFGERAAILDGNVKRVLTRALGFADDLARPAAERALWAQAEALLPARGIEPYTQGLMDLGATLCSQRQPRCPACPLATLCVAHAQGRPEAYPVKTRQLKRGQRASTWLVPMCGGQVWLRQRPATGVWAGLWCPVEFASLPDAQAAAQGWPGRAELRPAFTHVLTHLDWRLQPLLWHLPARQRARAAALGAGQWWPLPEALALGLPAPVQRLLSSLNSGLHTKE